MTLGMISSAAFKAKKKNWDDSSWNWNTVNKHNFQIHES